MFWPICPCRMSRRMLGFDRTQNRGTSGDLLQSFCLFFSLRKCLSVWTETSSRPFADLSLFFSLTLSLQDVQVDRWVLDQSHEPVVDFLDDEALLWFSLPAALHELMDLFRTRPRPLQLSALRDALDRLKTEKNLQVSVYKIIIWSCRTLSCFSASTVSLFVRETQRNVWFIYFYWFIFTHFSSPCINSLEQNGFLVTPYIGSRNLLPRTLLIFSHREYVQHFYL